MLRTSTLLCSCTSTLLQLSFNTDNYQTQVIFHLRFFMRLVKSQNKVQKMDALKTKQDERKKIAEKIRDLAGQVEDGWNDEQREAMRNYRGEIEKIDAEINTLREDAENAAFLDRLEADKDDLKRDDV